MAKVKWHSWAWGKVFSKGEAQKIAKDLRRQGRTVKLAKVKSGYKVRYQ